MSIFSERLTKLRKKNSLTQQQIADMININRVTYTNWEQGKREPNFYNLVQLSSILNTSTSYLLGEIDDEYNFGTFPTKEANLSKEEMKNLIFGFIIMADINNTSVDQILKENSNSKHEYEIFKQIYQETIENFRSTGNNSETTDTK